MATVYGAGVGGVFAAIPIFNQLVPNEGPLQISFDLDFSAADEYEFDLTQEIQKKIIWGVQSLYYDASGYNPDTGVADGVGADVQLAVSATAQGMIFKNKWQGFRPVFFSNPPKGVFRCIGGTGVFRVKLTNVPMPFGDWNCA